MEIDDVVHKKVHTSWTVFQKGLYYVRYGATTVEETSTTDDWRRTARNKVGATTAAALGFVFALALSWLSPTLVVLSLPKARCGGGGGLRPAPGPGFGGDSGACYERPGGGGACPLADGTVYDSSDGKLVENCNVRYDNLNLLMFSASP
ncbi:hypothetical protein KIN20_007204 [Parelaphostrongylus tenuis]|uniref:Uncharacterized protein n=1 Tax=Parelaphostrongylus tenuis TaxID=148309 RepID=A0AAD5M7H3_PARTN|nr:hypothetical protein KIN20_007204 [Parelaphostrongylus tenuis]